MEKLKELTSVAYRISQNLQTGAYTSTIRVYALGESGSLYVVNPNDLDNLKWQKVVSVESEEAKVAKEKK